MNVCVIGAGYVGLVAGACFAELGHHVICVDNNETKIACLQNGQVPIYEPGLEELVGRSMKEGRLRFSTHLPKAVQSSGFICMAVGTPPAQDGSADLSFVMDAAREVGENLCRDSLIIIKSTVPIGSADKIKQVIREQLDKRGRQGLEFDIVSNPEFLREGSAVQDFLHPDRIVIGVDNERAAQRMKELYKPLTERGYPLLEMDFSSAELTKYASNAMLAARISFMNEMAGICDAMGADIELVKQGMALDHRIGKHFLSAGVGYGGSCFPKDVRALICSASEMHVPAPILKSVEEVNREQKKKLFHKVIDHFGRDLSNKKFAVWGLAFKPDTDDMREAPSVETIRLLCEHGAVIHAHDPIAVPNARRIMGGSQIIYFEDPYRALIDANALLLLTEWRMYREADLDRVKCLLNQPVFFDGRNVYSPKMMRESGFIYYGIGRGVS